jgi:cadherin 23
VEIREDTPEGSEILEVHATDSDGSSPNNDVIYRITSGARDKFTVNPETGKLLK